MKLRVSCILSLFICLLGLPEAFAQTFGDAIPTTQGTSTPTPTQTSTSTSIRRYIPKSWKKELRSYPKKIRSALACTYPSGKPVILVKKSYRNLRVGAASGFFKRNMVRRLIASCQKALSEAAETPTPTTTPTRVPEETPTPTSTSIPAPQGTIPAACAGLHGSSCPVLLNISPEASGGDAINITGGTFSSDAKVFLNVVADNGYLIEDQKYQLSVINNQFAVLQARIPASLTQRTLWAVWIEQNGEVSNTLFINKALVTNQSTVVIAPGGELILWGRALSLGQARQGTPSVTFVSGGTRLAATLLDEDQFRLKVAAPVSIVPGVTYQVVVSNAAGGAQGEFTLKSPVLTIAKGSDPLGLNVYWVNEIPSTTWTRTYDVTSDSHLTLHAVGNGLANDYAALQAALDYAGSTGGGTVYLPPGTYRSLGELMFNYPNTVLLGAGKGTTTIAYGATGQAALSFSQPNLNRVGVSSLTFLNQYNGGSMNRSIYTYSYTGMQRLFVHNIELLLGSRGQTLSLGGYGGVRLQHILLANSKIVTTKREVVSGFTNAALSITLSDDLIVRDNRVEYDTGRNQFDLNNNFLLLNNSFIRNGSDAAVTARRVNNIETGCIEFSHEHDVVFDGNDCQVSPIFRIDHFNDSEVYMNQSSIYQFYKLGDVTGATATTIVDSGKNWQPGDLQAPFDQKAVIAITRGPGLGQARYITSYSGATVTVDRPWDIIPQPGLSSYTIGEWIGENEFLLDNRAEGGYWCVSMEGGKDINIQRHTCTDAGQLVIKSNDLYQGHGGVENINRYLGWNISLTQNRVQTTDKIDRNLWLPSSIKLASEKFVDPLGGGYGAAPLHGNTVFNAEIRDNVLMASTPNTPRNTDLFDGGLFTEDGQIFTVVEGAGSEFSTPPGYYKYSDAKYSILGTIVSHNSSPNYQGGGSYLKSTIEANYAHVFDD